MNKYILCAVVMMCSVSMRGMEEEKERCRGVHEAIKGGTYAKLQWSSLYDLWNNQGLTLGVSPSDSTCFFAKLTYCVLIDEVKEKLKNAHDFDSLWDAVEMSRSEQFADKRKEIGKSFRQEKEERDRRKEANRGFNRILLSYYEKSLRKRNFREDPDLEKNLGEISSGKDEE